MVKCDHCGEDLGDGDPYERMKAHLPYCKSEAAEKVRKAVREEDTYGSRYR